MLSQRVFQTPRIVVSQCLGFAACRYNGATIPDDFVKRLEAHVTCVTVCPEVEIGLGVPRDPIRIIQSDHTPHLVQPATGADVTEKMQAFSRRFLENLTDIDGFILKGRSPSCGIQDVKIHHGAEKGAFRSKGRGFFGQAVLERYPHLPVEEEGRLTSAVIREHFLTAIFALADFRAVKTANTLYELIQFHGRNKLLWMACNEKQLRLMGPIVANREKKSPREVIQAYEPHLWQTLARPPRRASGVNALMHAFGYFKEQLSPEEKAYFLELLEKYRLKKITLTIPTTLIESWIVRFGEPYLAQQTLFSPYPETLQTPDDSQCHKQGDLP